MTCALLGSCIRDSCLFCALSCTSFYSNDMLFFIYAASSYPFSGLQLDSLNTQSNFSHYGMKLQIWVVKKSRGEFILHSWFRNIYCFDFTRWHNFTWRTGKYFGKINNELEKNQLERRVLIQNASLVTCRFPKNRWNAAAYNALPSLYPVPPHLSVTQTCKDQSINH